MTFFNTYGNFILNKFTGLKRVYIILLLNTRLRSTHEVQDVKQLLRLHRPYRNVPVN